MKAMNWNHFLGKGTKSMNQTMSRKFRVIFFTFVFFSSLTSVLAQTFPADTICGDWVIDPEPPEGEYKYFSCRKRFSGYEFYLLNQPNARFSGLADIKKEYWLAIIDGMLLRVTWRKEDDHIIVFRHEENEMVFEMKRVQLPQETEE
jgi:hypothetical protein